MLRFVIQRPIAVSMLFLALILIGLLSFQRLPVDLLPSITYPRLTVITTYEDIPAEDLERLVTQRIEEVVTALSGVRRVVSRGSRSSPSSTSGARRWTSPTSICAKRSTAWPSETTSRGAPNVR
jgi:multidrug efflux pump subunit AcrB